LLVVSSNIFMPSVALLLSGIVPPRQTLQLKKFYLACRSMRAKQISQFTIAHSPR
jgi:hypothetical protein